jgi:hypothetical protein
VPAGDDEQPVARQLDDIAVRSARVALDCKLWALRQTAGRLQVRAGGCPGAWSEARAARPRRGGLRIFRQVKLPR